MPAVFLTHEIGSLAKPAWRVKAFADKQLAASDIQEAEKWGKLLDIAESDALLAILNKRTGFTADDKAVIMRFASLYATRLMEQAGIDLVWDGEQHRVEMYEYAIRHMTGFNLAGHVRSFDNKYYNKAACVAPPGIERPYHLEEYKQIAQFAVHPVKIPITGAYTLVDWSYDEHYLSTVVPGKADVHEKRKSARMNFLHEVASQVIYPNIQALVEAGAKYIQIDEPAATTKRDEIDGFVQGMKASIGDLANKAFFSVHICFSDYQRLFPAINELQGILHELHFEFANRDSKELGVNGDKRIGYEILKQFKNSKFIAGVGVTDVHTDFIESPELIRDRILYANDIVGDPQRLYIAPDCGLRTRTWEVSFAKLKNMVEGVELAKQKLGL